MSQHRNVPSPLRRKPAMAASSSTRMPEIRETEEGHAARASPPPTPTTLVMDKTLSTAANLAQLLPTGTVLTFQALAPSFTRGGACYASNRCLISVLIALNAVSCVFFSITDSLVGADNRLYYGVATLRSLYVFNYNGADEEVRRRVLGDLEEYRLRPLDYVHAVFTVLVFLTIAFGDAMVQHCLFPDAGPNARELLVNLPLGAGVVSTLVFIVFPTSRKGIGYTNTAPTSQ
ncbi:protein DMP3-like [Musa acuminata AAA Group]|uniref:protein DMP3-like n=1 Tax=Musa acuminata AAA Group TaxID=214697 RepID=UPI0031E22435